MVIKESCISRLPLPQPHPWLVFSHGTHSEIQDTQTFFSISEDCYYVRYIPEFRDKEICTCSHGWLVMIDIFSADCSLLNLISMEKIQLPSCKGLGIRSCVLSLPPKDPGCTIMINTADDIYMLFCKPGDNEWTKQELEPENQVDSNLISVNGKIYGLVEDNVVEIEVGIDNRLTLKRTRVEKIPRPFLQARMMINYSLVEYCLDVFAVCKYSIGNENKTTFWKFEVFKLSSSITGLKWNKLESLGDCSFFLNACGCSMSCPTTNSGIKGNCIYYTEMDDKSLFIFDLEDNSVVATLPCPNVDHDSDEPEWIMPVV